MSGVAFNPRNPSVKRILQEIKEFQRDDSPDIMAEALEDNIFEWHFVVRGATDTEFEGGIYHGRILLPSEYPFKPPSFLMLTPNGRFETGVKVCLSISSHHPEHWQPSWSVRTALVALIAFMQTPGNGAIGSLDYSKEERRALARKSRAQPPQFGNSERQALTNGVHTRMLEREAAAVAAATNPAAGSADAAEAATPASPAEQSTEQPSRETAASAPPAAEAAPAVAPQHADAAPQPQPQPAAELRQRPAAAAAASSIQHQPAADDRPPPTPFSGAATGAHMAPQPFVQQALVPSWEETGLTVLAVVIIAAIAALLIRKVLIGFGDYNTAASQSSFI